METSKMTQTVVTLKLNDKEAALLAGLIQNGIPSESPEVAKLREQIFNACKPDSIR